MLHNLLEALINAKTEKEKEKEKAYKSLERLGLDRKTANVPISDSKVKETIKDINK